MAWFWWLLFALIAVMWIAALVDIIRRRHSMSGGKLAAWLLIIIIFPILGAIAYFLVHGAGGPSGAPRDPGMGRQPGM
jgi:Phospholipase_D-nuclease N-terminal